MTSATPPPTPPTSTTPLLPPSPSSLRSLIPYTSLEPWRQDNSHILTSYRQTLHSYRLCLLSIFQLHNETINIWTHLLGSIVAISSLIYISSTISTSATTTTTGRQGWSAPYSRIPNPFPSVERPSVTWLDTAGFACFFLSAATCLGLSASFHSLSCHSMKVAQRWNSLDYVGISVLISGTFAPCVHYGFFCDPHLRNFYLIMIYFAASVTTYVVLTPHAKTPAYRRRRAWTFIALGASAVIPVAHGILRYSLSHASESLALPWLAIGGVLYIIGAILYAERCPERFLPGSFDLFGASHQIFHVLILLAAWSHWCAIAEGFRFWHEEMEGGCPVL